MQPIDHDPNTRGGQSLNKWPLSLPPFKAQKKAIVSAQGKEGYGYFMEMGLGKTAVVLAEFLRLYQEGQVTGLIVVCPNSLKRNWIKEAEKMGADFPVKLAWPAAVDPRADDPWLQTINYEAVITKGGYAHLSLLLSNCKVMLVLDESTQIKNHQAKRTRVLIALGKFAQVRRILSGAPLTQGPHDLWSQLRFIGQIPGINYYVFRNMFCAMGGWQGKQVVGAKNEAQLNELLRGCSFRAKKGEWLDLPPKIYQSRYIEHTAAQKKHYAEMARNLVTVINQEQIDVAQVITQMTKLQQIGSGFIIDNMGVPHDLPGTNPKIEVVQEILAEAVGKTIIFTYFRRSAEILKGVLGGSAVVIEGGLAKGAIDVAVDRFNNDPLIRVLIAQVQSAKYGLTLLGGENGERCATTIFYENSFSLDARIQAEDRNHRIGQDRPVVYVDIIGSEIDEIAIRALQSKKDVASAIVDGIKVDRGGDARKGSKNRSRT